MTAVRPAADPHTIAAPTDARPRGWRRLLAASAVASAGTFLVVAVALGDMEAAAYAAAYGIGAGLLRWRRGRLGAALLGLANLNVVVWMSLGALSNVPGGRHPVFVAVPAVLAGLALAGAIAAAAVLLRPDAPARRAPLAVAVTAVVAVAAVSGVALVAGGGDEAPADVLTVTSDNVAFAETQLAAPAGPVTVRMANADLFWHTLTIDELGVDLWVPVGGERDVTFDAPPGSYPFYCRIPGHESRMRGVLTVD